MEPQQEYESVTPEGRGRVDLDRAAGGRVIMVQLIVCLLLLLVGLCVRYLGSTWGEMVIDWYRAQQQEELIMGSELWQEWGEEVAVQIKQWA